MVKNYLLIAFRSFRRNYIYTIINILGMAVGLAGVILTILLYQYESDFDKNQVGSSSYYRVNSERITENSPEKWGIVPNALGPAIAAEQKGIERFCRFSYNSSFLVQYEDNIHREQIAFADPTFFSMFSFRSLSGDPDAFKNKYTAVISRELAAKYFGDSDALGKELTLRLDNAIFGRFTIGAILDKIPKNSSFQFGIILQHENLLDAFHLEDEDWSAGLQTVLYLDLNEQTDASRLEESIQKYVAIHNEVMDTRKIAHLNILPFNKQKENARIINNYTTGAGLPISALYGSVIMNTLILLIACFNFTNTSLVYANKRLREIGIRKTFGGGKWQIFAQFFFESFVMCMMALIISVELSSWWVELLNRQWPIEIRTYTLNQLKLTVSLFMLLLAVSLIAGTYPAYYASRFNPTAILRGKVKLVGSNSLSKILLTWQFGFSIMAIFSGIVLTQNAWYQKTLDWGFDFDNAIIIPLKEEANYTTLRNSLLKYNQIERISGTVQNLGYNALNVQIELNGVPHDSKMLLVGDSYLNAIGCRVVEGRMFHENSDYDRAESILVNEKFVSTFNLQNPIAQTIRHDGKSYQVVGVLKDFMPYGLFAPIVPVIIHPVPEESFQNLVLTAKVESLPDLMDMARLEWKKLYPNLPFEGMYMSANAAEAFDTNRGIMIQFLINALFALFLSTTGLYAVVSLNINKRIKEIGIRKVFGASVTEVMRVMNKEFFFILAIAAVIGCAGGYFFMSRFLSDIFSYYLQIGPLTFIFSSLVVLLLTASTSGVKVYNAALQNPTNSIRNE